MAPEVAFIWRNNDTSPKKQDFPIVYCTMNNKIGTLTSSNWEFYKDKYNIKWWVSAKDLLP